MSDNTRILVVGTTTDYIDTIRSFCQGRVLFLTQADLRRTAVEPAPAAEEEVLYDTTEAERIQTGLQRHLLKYRLELVGITAFDCESLLLAALLAQSLHLPFATPQAVNNCRDKNVCKELWRQSGLRTPAAQAVKSAAEAEAFFRRHGGRGVMKPCRGSGSEMVVFCARPQDAKTLHRTVSQGLRRIPSLQEKDIGSDEENVVVVEEFVDATEYSADIAIYNGNVRILRLAKKYKSLLPVFGITEAYLLLSGLPLATERMETVFLQACKALGLDRAVCMVDFFVQGEELILLELSPRPGGDCLTFLYRQATGQSMLQQVLEFSVNPETKFADLESIQPHLGVRIFAQHNGILERVTFGDLAQDPTIKEGLLYRPVAGLHITVPPEDYNSWVLGHVTARLSARESPEEKIAAIKREIVVHYR